MRAGRTAGGPARVDVRVDAVAVAARAAVTAVAVMTGLRVMSGPPFDKVMHAPPCRNNRCDRFTSLAVVAIARLCQDAR